MLSGASTDVALELSCYRVLGVISLLLSWVLIDMVPANASPVLVGAIVGTNMYTSNNPLVSSMFCGVMNVLSPLSDSLVDGNMSPGVAALNVVMLLVNNCMSGMTN